jgi:hypothetical protein
MLDLINVDNDIKDVTREQVMDFEDVLRTLPPLDMEQHTHHHFAPDVYVRELFIPEGVALTGKIHKHELMNILVSGTVRVNTDDGMETLTGPLIFNSRAGTKRAIYGITDAIWLNVHPTGLTDLDEIEEEFIAPSFEALDYRKFLLDANVTEDEVQEMTNRPHNGVMSSDLKVLPSNIHGEGLFSNKKIKMGDTIALMKDCGEKTPSGRYCNHSGTPNAEMIMVDKDTIKLVSLRDICDEEITTDYRNNMQIQESKQ